MKYLTFFIVFLSFLTGCSNAPVATPASDTCQLVQNFDKKVSFTFDGFGGKNVPVDFNVRQGYVGVPFDSSDTVLMYSLKVDPTDGSFEYEARAGMSYGVKLGDDNDYVKLRVVAPKIVSGEYEWGGTTKMGNIGVTFQRTRGG